MQVVLPKNTKKVPFLFVLDMHTDVYCDYWKEWPFSPKTFDIPRISSTPINVETGGTYTKLHSKAH